MGDRFGNADQESGFLLLGLVLELLICRLGDAVVKSMMSIAEYFFVASISTSFSLETAGVRVFVVFFLFSLPRVSAS